MHVKSRDPRSLDLTGTGSCAAFNFRRTARVVTRLYDLALAPSGIRATQFAILTAIAKYQPVPISRVGELLLLDQTTLTRSLRLLQKEGHIEISPRSTRRQRFLSLTDAGVKVLAAALPLWREIQAKFQSQLAGEQWPELRDELRRLAGLAIQLESAEQKTPTATPSAVETNGAG